MLLPGCMAAGCLVHEAWRTHFWTLALLFLFFRPKVLSSAACTTTPPQHGVSCDALLHELWQLPFNSTFCLLAILALSAGLLLGAIYTVRPRGRAAVQLPRMHYGVMVGV